MQNGSLMQTSQRRGPSVWEYRWKEPRSDGRRIHRRIVIGTADRFKSESAALKAIVALRREINLNDLRLRASILTLSELVEHCRAAGAGPRQRMEDSRAEDNARGLHAEVDRTPLGEVHLIQHWVRCDSVERLVWLRLRRAVPPGSN
jgi:hypothetical protein